MMYNLVQTLEAKKDIKDLAAYMINSLKNEQAANNFLNQYQKQFSTLTTFPFAYQGINYTYQGYEIRLKPFSSYYIFFVVDASEQQITVLRVLKDRQNWKTVLRMESKYSF